MKGKSNQLTALLDLALNHVEILLTGTTLVSAGFALHYISKFNESQRLVRNSVQTIDNLSEGFYRSSIEGRQLSANPALVSLNGYRSEQELLTSIKDIAKEWYVDTNRRDLFKKLLYENGFVENFVSEIYRHKSRERIWISENARLVCDQKTGEPLYYEGTVRDITSERRYVEGRNRLKKISESLPGGLFELTRDKNGKFTAPYLSNTFIKLAGLPIEGANGLPNSYLKHIHPDDLASYLEALNKSAENLSSINVSFRYKKNENEICWIRLMANVSEGKEGSITWHGYISDTTEEKLAIQKTEKLAFYDPLTGLAKRSVIEMKLEQVINACNRRAEHAALLFLDLDNFKHLNDTQGHEAGDILLSLVAKRLNKSIRVTDMASRFGGDEFVILIDNLEHDRTLAIEKAAKFATKIINGFQDAFDLNGYICNISTSIGIALIDTELMEVEEVIKRADMAMYQAKKNGRAGYSIYSGTTEQTSLNAHDCSRDLKGSVDRSEFELLLQPQMDRQQKIVGAEAFLRWNHPTFGVMSPADFIPMAERNGAIMEINEWVTRSAIGILENWQKSPTMQNCSLSINVSNHQFSSNSFDQFLASAMEQSSFDRGLLTLELTESMLNRDTSHIKMKMDKLKALGLRLSLDDFGSGASSLSILNSLPFDQIKIDGAFISSIENKEQNRNLIEGILSLANILKLETVAEHVGSTYQEKYLRDRGCKLYQGYHFHAPMSLAAFEETVLMDQTPVINEAVA